MRDPLAAFVCLLSLFSQRLVLMRQQKYQTSSHFTIIGLIFKYKALLHANSFSRLSISFDRTALAKRASSFCNCRFVWQLEQFHYTKLIACLSSHMTNMQFQQRSTPTNGRKTQNQNRTIQADSKSSEKNASTSFEEKPPRHFAGTKIS